MSLLRVSDIANLTLPPGTKGLPLDGSIQRVGDLTGRGLNLLRGDLPMPVAVLKRAALENNLRVMQEYIGRVGIKLAPHAKTTMCPQLFERQLQHGCWGLSVATMTQLKLCHDLGVERLILANQLVGRAEINALGCLWAQAPERAYYVLVDGFSGAQAISEGFRHCPGSPPARLLIEIGMSRGRCGVRTVDEGLVLARAIRALPHVELHGIAGYEGLIVSDHAGKDAAAVAEYLATVVRLYEAIASEKLFQNPEQVIISAGGSAYYDLVAQVVAAGSRSVVPILRSGCYLTHDAGFYGRLLQRIDDRAVAGPAPHLTPALEVWSRVISRPEPNLAIVMLGKRDVSYDIDLPVPRLWYREGWHEVPQPVDGWTVHKLNDQHGYLTVPPQARLAVGDLLGFDISHPCTTFDKWSLLLEVDESYTVLGGLKTFF